MKNLTLKARICREGLVSLDYRKRALLVSTGLRAGEAVLR